MLYKLSKFLFLLFIFYLSLISNFLGVIPGMNIILGSGMLLFLFGAKLFNRNKVVFTVPAAFQLFTIFGIYCLFVGVFIAVDPTHLVISLFTYAQIIVLIFYIINVSSIDKTNKFFVLSFIVFSAIYMIIMLIWGHTRVDGRLTLAFGVNPNDAGRILLYGLALTLIYLTYAKKNYRIFAFVLIGCFIYTISLTGSRKALFASAFLCGIWVLLVYTRRWFLYSFMKKTLSILIIFMVFVIFVVNLNNLFLESSTYQRIVSKGANLGEDDVRTSMYSEAFSFFSENIFFGIGYDHFRILSSFGTYSHSTYAELLSTTGIIGTLIFLTAYIIIITKLSSLILKSSSNEKYSAISYLILFVTMLILGLGVIHYYEIIDFIVIGIIISYYKNVNYENGKSVAQ